MKYRRVLLTTTFSVSYLAHGAQARADGNAQGSASEENQATARAEGRDQVRKKVAEPRSNLTADSRAAYADHLFQEGYQLMKSDDCPKALPKFQSSQQLDPSAASLINIATCQARLGRIASAWRTYRLAASLAVEEGSDDLRERAFKAISILTPSLTKLKVIPPRGSTSLVVTLNGERFAVDDGMPIALDPGENILEATITGRPTWRHTINAADAGTTIVIEVPEAPPAETSHWTAWRTAATVTGGAGAIALVSGLVVGLSANSTYREANQYCQGNQCTQPGVDLWQSADRKARAATYLVAGGAVLSAGAIGLWFFAPARSTSAVRVAPWAAEGKAVGATVEGPL